MAEVYMLAAVNGFFVLLLFILFWMTGSLTDLSGFEWFSEMLWMSWGQLSGKAPKAGSRRLAVADSCCPYFRCIRRNVCIFAHRRLHQIRPEGTTQEPEAGQRSCFREELLHGDRMERPNAAPHRTAH